MRLTKIAARAADVKKAEEVTIIEMREVLPITDFFVIGSGATTRQTKAIANWVETALAKEGLRPYMREGFNEGVWILLDYIDFVVHIFRNQEREYYQIEKLWKDAPIVEWRKSKASENSKS